MKHNKGPRKSDFSTGTIFVSEEEMRKAIGHFSFDVNHQIHLQKLMNLRQKMIRAKHDGKLGNGQVYFTYGNPCDHAHLHFFANDFESAKSFFEVLETLDEYIYFEKNSFRLLRAVQFFHTALFLFIDISYFAYIKQKALI